MAVIITSFAGPTTVSVAVSPGAGLPLTESCKSVEPNAGTAPLVGCTRSHPVATARNGAPEHVSALKIRTTCPAGGTVTIAGFPRNTWSRGAQIVGVAVAVGVAVGGTCVGVGVRVGPGVAGGGVPPTLDAVGGAGVAVAVRAVPVGVRGVPGVAVPPGDTAPVPDADGDAVAVAAPPRAVTVTVTTTTLGVALGVLRSAAAGWAPSLRRVSASGLIGARRIATNRPASPARASARITTVRAGGVLPGLLARGRSR